MSACHYCGTTDDCRPYGPGGSYVCHPCATANPERDAECGGRFGALLDANLAISPSGVIAIGGGDGPRPFDPASTPSSRP